MRRCHCHPWRPLVAATFPPGHLSSLILLLRATLLVSCPSWPQANAAIPTSQDCHPRRPTAITVLLSARTRHHDLPAAADGAGRHAGGPVEATAPPGLPAPAPMALSLWAHCRPAWGPLEGPDGRRGAAAASKKEQDCGWGAGRAGSRVEAGEEEEGAQHLADECKKAHSGPPLG